ncbi:hypothetical protein OJF2_13180 [Aquisphaera giovannonii]|uniref:Glycosyltransferase RgtA/B/C/D-like domain-containing protein n=1 Tax=Aquisphaera giovannonii TaxID=406548 RepID=A0A5B9VXM0_9BACT|nr:hypothetical protein [Aquisphaera giovannonii]QEH32834.1 hypothetical protein OJF2_13180 [Aquisphaera giovannonii]
MNRSGSRRWHAAAASALLAAWCAFWFADTVADPDLWGHVRFGQDLLRTGSILQQDIYSYRSEGQPWVNHEWLAEAAFASAYDHLGARGLIVGKLAIALAIVAACDVHLRRKGLGAFPRAALLIAASIPFRMGLGTVRPQAFTYLGYLALLLILEGEGGRPTSWRGWLLPPLLAAWANLHGGVLAGVAAVTLWIGVRLVRVVRQQPTRAARLRAAWPLAALALACGVAPALNPWGFGLVRFLLRTATVPRPEITEWSPLVLTSLPGVIVLGLLATVLVSVAESRRRPLPESLLVLAVSAVLPMVSNRHYPLFALAMIVLGGGSIAKMWDRATSSLSPGRGGGGPVAAAGLAAALILAALVPGRLRCVRLDPYFFSFPARAVEYLRLGGADGNMAVPFDWGEYVLWQLGPKVKVSMDGRRETLYSDEAYRQSRDFERGTGAWDALLRTGPPTDIVLTPLGSPTMNLLARTDGWTALYRDRCCVVFVRKGYPGLDRLTKTPVPGLPDDGDGLCFPGPADQ